MRKQRSKQKWGRKEEERGREKREGAGKREKGKKQERRAEKRIPAFSHSSRIRMVNFQLVLPQIPLRRSQEKRLLKPVPWELCG